MEMKGYDTIESKDDKTKIMTIDEAYEMAGVNSCYHITLLISMFVVIIHALWVMFALPLLEIFPRVRGCPDLQSTSLCHNATAACGRVYAYDDPHHNFMTEYDLICHPYQAALIPAIYGIGGLPSSLLAGCLSDLFGRMRMINTLAIATLASLLIILIVSNYVVMVIFVFVCGFCETLLFTACFSAIADTVHTRNMTVYITTFNLSYPISQLTIALIMLSNMRWRVLFVIICLLGSLFFVFLIWVREPPRFLLSKGRDAEAIANLRHIAKVNCRVLPEKISLQDTSAVSQRAPGFCDMMRLLCQCWLLKRFLPAVYMFISVGYIFYAMIFNVQKFSSSPQYLLLIMAGAEIALVLLSGFFYKCMGRGLLPLAFCLIIVALIVHYTVREYPLLRNACLVICTLCPAMVYNVVDIVAGEKYPAAIKNTLMALLSFASRIGTPLGAFFGISYPLLIWFGVCLCAVGVIVAIYFALINLDDPEPETH